jgi:hypothetical protein
LLPVVTDFRTILRLWPDESAIREDLAGLGVVCRRGTVNKWGERNMIPARYFNPLVAAAGKRGLTVGGLPLSLEHLATAAILSAREREIAHRRRDRGRALCDSS